jgi:peptidyl-tRNA hydrolase, PTH1 family
VRLIVGLGNIGSKYANNRHNIGFMVVDELVEKYHGDWSKESKLSADVAKLKINEETVIIAKPTTLMNGSGNAVQKLMQFYKISPDDVWIIYDDLDTEFGMARVRAQGSSGGHNGIGSIIDKLGSDFKRFRFGISLNDRSIEPSEVYVLKPFNNNEEPKLRGLIDSSVEILINYIVDSSKTLNEGIINLSK